MIEKEKEIVIKYKNKFKEITEKIVVKYEVECDNCRRKAILWDIGDFGYFGKKLIRYYCKKCKKMMYRWQ